MLSAMFLIVFYGISSVVAGVNDPGKKMVTIIISLIFTPFVGIIFAMLSDKL
jgi:phosphate/sulfate permease